MIFKIQKNEKGMKEIMKMTKSKKAICLIFSIVCLMCISGCSGDAASKEADISKTITSKNATSQKAGKELKQYESPMVCIYSDYLPNNVEEIYVDIETKNLYLFRKLGSGAGMTQLTNEDGSPKKLEGNLENYVQY